MTSVDKWSVIFAAVVFVYSVLSLGIFAPVLMSTYVDAQDVCVALIGMS